MTYGQLRLAISQENPGLSLELMDGWIQDRYTQILDRLMWKRQEAETIIQVPDSYATGTVAVTRESSSITGTGTTWTSAMTGRMIRIGSLSEYYQFTYTSATTGTLDRNYEGPTATGLSYRIDQALFLMPSDARHIVAVRPLHGQLTPLEVITPDEANRISANRTQYGTPRYAIRSYDSFSDPPQLQIEFYPIPDAPNSISETPSFAVMYQFEQAAIDSEDTDASLLPWVRPAALKAGVRADWLNSEMKKDYAGAQVFEAKFNTLVAEMLQINARQRGVQQVRMAPEYTRRNYSGMPPVNTRWWER